MIALSIRQPWAWLILHAGKDIENRTWRTNFRGRILIHASKGMTLDEYESGWLAAEDCDGTHRGSGNWPLPSFDSDALKRGGIVGSVEIVDCVTASRSLWFGGPFGFVLRNPTPLPFHPCRGSLGFFNVENVPTQ